MIWYNVFLTTSPSLITLWIVPSTFYQKKNKNIRISLGSTFSDQMGETVFVDANGVLVNLSSHETDQSALTSQCLANEDQPIISSVTADLPPSPQSLYITVASADGTSTPLRIDDVMGQACIDSHDQTIDLLMGRPGSSRVASLREDVPCPTCGGSGRISRPFIPNNKNLQRKNERIHTLQISSQDKDLGNLVSEGGTFETLIQETNPVENGFQNISEVAPIFLLQEEDGTMTQVSLDNAAEILESQPSGSIENLPEGNSISISKCVEDAMVSETTNDTKPLDLDPEDVWKMIKKEMKTFNLSQEVFASVAMGKTQGTFSDMVKRHEGGAEETKASLATLMRCKDFLQKTDTERKRFYAEFRMGNKTKRKLAQEYQGEDHVKRKSCILDPLGIGVLKEFYTNVGHNLDNSDLDILSDTLDVEKKTILKWVSAYKHGLLIK